jgi:pantothenate kinase
MRVSVDDLVAAARGLVSPGERRFLGITGAPGAGKSTVAELVVAGLGEDAVLVSMDGFHLSNTELRRLGRLERKGASDTFDAAGYVNLLERLHARTDAVVYAPWFDRSLEESIGSAIPVPADVPLIVTEGNYLLADGPEWGRISPLLDECWYVEPGDDVRLQRLVARHQRFGRSLEEARDRSYGSDGRNAELIAATRSKATRIIEPVQIST